MRESLERKGFKGDYAIYLEWTSNTEKYVEKL